MTPSKRSTAERDYNPAPNTYENSDHTPHAWMEDAGNILKRCKVCDTYIDSTSTSEKGLLAELCDHCWELQNEDMP